jgi:hypothetical protein
MDFREEENGILHIERRGKALDLQSAYSGMAEYKERG